MLHLVKNPFLLAGACLTPKHSCHDHQWVKSRSPVAGLEKEPPSNWLNFRRKVPWEKQKWATRKTIYAHYVYKPLIAMDFVVPWKDFLINPTKIRLCWGSWASTSNAAGLPCGAIQETNKWLSKNSKTCSCGAIIQRSGGCNHMWHGGKICLKNYLSVGGDGHVQHYNFLGRMFLSPHWDVTIWNPLRSSFILTKLWFHRSGVIKFPI